MLKCGHRVSVLLCLSVVLAASGCASTKPRGTGVLVPGTDGRAARVVPLPTDWQPATVRALRASPGCLGVEAGQTTSGKRAIFAMFKDKAAVTAWYRDPAHQAMVGKVSFYRQHEHIPAAGVPDDAGPIMVIATMTPAPASQGVPPGTMLLSVELFSPLPGGVRFGGASLLPRPTPALDAPASSPRN